MSVTYSESFVTALIASFMARDAKIPIDNAGVARYLSMLGEEKTASAIEHQTRAMKAKAKTLVAGGDEAVTPPKATPRKRSKFTLSDCMHADETRKMLIAREQTQPRSRWRKRVLRRRPRAARRRQRRPPSKMRTPKKTRWPSRTSSRMTIITTAMLSNRLTLYSNDIRWRSDLTLLLYLMKARERRGDNA